MDTESRQRAARERASEPEREREREIDDGGEIKEEKRAEEEEEEEMRAMDGGRGTDDYLAAGSYKTSLVLILEY